MGISSALILNRIERKERKESQMEIEKELTELLDPCGRCGGKSLIVESGNEIAVQVQCTGCGHRWEAVICDD